MNVLVVRGHKVSKAKARLCQKEGRYLGLNLSKGRRTLGERRIKPILAFPLPQTLRQPGFPGHHWIGRLWIPGYGEIAHPLYQLVKGAQRGNPSTQVWEPEAE